MAKRNKRTKKVSQSARPSEGKQVRQSENPESSDRETVAWRISDFDWQGPWGDKALKDANLPDLVREWASNFEKQTWFELMSASGGKTLGTNHHRIEIEKLSKLAKDRLTALKKDDLDSVFSFRISSRARVYGIKDRRAFCALWYDPWHGDQKKAVCASKKRHT